jgi:hypothetical protein
MPRVYMNKKSFSKGMPEREKKSFNPHQIRNFCFEHTLARMNSCCCCMASHDEEKVIVTEN